jgi:NDP-sugar pyrophosphorylase family protein
MKALLVLRERDCGWLRKISPATHPAMFPVCNKPLLEYFVDFAILNGCSDIRVVMDKPGKDVESYFKQGHRWGIAMSYGSFMDDETIDQILNKNTRYCQESTLLIFDGFFFIHYDKEANYGNWQQDADCSPIISCATGSVLYARNRHYLGNISSAQNRVDFALSPLESLDDLYQISMQVVAAEQQHYVLPGYGAEKGIVLGRNVEIGRNVTINEPAVIGNNVRILGDAVVGPFAVIGNNVIVDEGTHIQESVILNESYLGRDLTIKKKVIKGNRIFSYGEKEGMVIEDAFLISAMQKKHSLPILHTLSNSLAAIILLVFLGIPYILLAGLRKIQNDWHQQDVTYFNNNSGETLSVRTVASNQKSLTGKLCSVLFLDRVPLLVMVVRGKLRLVGNRLLEASEENSRVLEDFQEYQPGVFGYSEAEDVTPESLESIITERFFAAHRSFPQDCRMLMRILFANLSSHR